MYGIYDMAGGLWERVTGILSSKKSNSTYYDFSGIDSKYYDSYDDYNNTKYGDAVYETSTSSKGVESWDDDFSNFVDLSSPVFRRGGSGFDISHAGLFCFHQWDTGENYPYNAFRPCLVSSQ